MGSTPQRPGHRLWESGNRLVREGKFPEAVVVFSDAIRCNAGEADYYHNRAVARAASHDAEGAREDVWRARELDPEAPDSRSLEQALGGPTGWNRPDREPENLWPGPGSDRRGDRDAPPLELLLSALRTE